MVASAKLKIVEGEAREVARTPDPARPRMARRIAQIDLPEPDYEGFWVKGWMNYPPSVGQDLASRDEERTYRALMTIIVDHNLVDFDGEPYPAASERAFWDALPVDVVGVILTEVTQNVGRLPKPNAAR